MLKILPFLNEKIFEIRLEKILKIIIPDIHTYLENLNKPVIEKNQRLMIGRLLISGTRINEAKLSARKEAIRKTQLFDDLNLHKLFLLSFNVII